CWRRHHRDDTLVPGLGGLRDGGSFYPRRPQRCLLLCDALALSPQGLEDEGLLLCLVCGALLRAPTSFSSCIRSGSAGRVALTGLNFDVRPGGAIRTAPAGLLGVVSLSGCFGAASADIALLFLCSSLLGRLGPSSH